MLYLLFQRCEDEWYALIEAAPANGAPPKRVSWYARFARDAKHYLSVAPTLPFDAARSACEMC